MEPEVGLGPRYLQFAALIRYRCRDHGNDRSETGFDHCTVSSATSSRGERRDHAAFERKHRSNPRRPIRRVAAFLFCLPPSTRDVIMVADAIACTYDFRQLLKGYLFGHLQD